MVVRVVGVVAVLLGAAVIMSGCGSSDGDDTQAVDAESGFSNDTDSDSDAGDGEEVAGGLDPAASRTDDADDGPKGEPSDAQGEPSAQTTVPATEAPDTAPPTTVAAYGNLILDDASPALDGFAAAIGDDYQATELVLYPTYAILRYQDPAAPENIDSRTWRDGNVDEADPVGLTADGYAETLFAPGDVSFDAIPGLAQEAIDGFALANSEVSHVIIDRFFGMDDGSIAIRVYVSDPDRGGGGYLLARADGTVVELIG